MVDGGVEHGGDVFLLQEHAQQRLAVGQPADAEVPEERLGRDVGELDLLLETGLAQLVGDVEQVLVGRAEASGALGGTDDDVARVVEEPSPAFAGVLGVIQGRDRVGVAVRAQAGHSVEVVAVAGGDHQVVVAYGRPSSHRLAGQVEAVASACTKSTPWASKVGASGKVMSSAGVSRRAARSTTG